MTVNGPVAFNIVSTGEDKNDAWLANGGALFSVDLKTGKATMVGKFQGLTGNLGDSPGSIDPPSPSFPAPDCGRGQGGKALPRAPRGRAICH